MRTTKAGRWLSVLVIVLLALIVGGCSQAASPTPAPTPTQTPTQTPFLVEIKDFAFNPQTILLKKGTTVRWSQQDSVTHTVTSTSSSPGDEFDSGNLRQGETFEHTFTVSGTYEYHCEIHPSMTGKIVVGEYAGE